jgi:predicted nuclease of restriction endonuclease-like (RecB) superfamily
MEIKKLSFAKLVESIDQVHKNFAAQAINAINISLTLRNWLMGYYIEEYERKGVDRARYGEMLMDKLATALQKRGTPRCDRRELYRYREFYLSYPQIVESVTPQLVPISEKTRLAKERIVESATPQWATSRKLLLERLSFTHFVELLQIGDPFKRSFYEQACIRGNWTVRELKHQIASLYYERSGLSKNKKKLAAQTPLKAKNSSPDLVIRDPYVFEFLGLKSQEVMGESNLEDALLDKMQNFLLELGHGFCFEARQKRISIGGEYFFVDLVFYHRILKCHVLIELKVDDFKHEHLGQLNTYVNYYKKNEISEGDNLPVGILLCTKKNHALVEYALAGMNNKLFVSKYQVELPEKHKMQKFFEAQLKKVVKEA